MWRQVKPQQRLGEYLGKTAHNSTESASLADIIPMHGLAPDIKVSDIIDTESKLQCYRYQGVELGCRRSFLRQ